MAADLEDSSNKKIAIICCSMKPAPNKIKKSAVRSICEDISAQLISAKIGNSLIDLRDRPLPLFNGQTLHENEDPIVKQWIENICAHKALLFGVPAYWSNASGAFVNMINVLCGPIYDSPSDTTIFKDKTCGYFIVGADIRSAEISSNIVSNMLAHVGVTQPFSPVVIGNPRESNNDWPAVSSELIGLSAKLLHYAISNDI